MRRIGMGFVAGIALASLLSGQEAKPAGSAWDSRKSAWEQLRPGQKDEVFRFAEGYKSYLTVSRSALTSTQEVLRLAKAAGFADFSATEHSRGAVDGNDEERRADRI